MKFLIDAQLPKRDKGVVQKIRKPNIWIPKSLRTAWKTAIESHTSGKIKVIVETIQENL